MHTFVTGFGRNFSHKATVLFVAQLYLPGDLLHELVALVLGGFVRGAHAGPPTVDSPAVASLAPWISALKAW